MTVACALMNSASSVVVLFDLALLLLVTRREYLASPATETTAALTSHHSALATPALFPWSEAKCECKERKQHEKGGGRAVIVYFAVIPFSSFSLTLLPSPLYPSIPPFSLPSLTRQVPSQWFGQSQVKSTDERRGRRREAKTARESKAERNTKRRVREMVCNTNQRQ